MKMKETVTAQYPPETRVGILIKKTVICFRESLTCLKQPRSMIERLVESESESEQADIKQRDQLSEDNDESDIEQAEQSDDDIQTMPNTTQEEVEIEQPTESKGRLKTQRIESIHQTLNSIGRHASRQSTI